MNSKGFTLLEIVIVLAILGLLVAGTIGTLSASYEQKKRQDTQLELEEIREALIGYVMINNRLPCPSTELDPSSASYGEEDSSACNTQGFLPWKLLGVTETDPWGSPRSSATDSTNHLWVYRVDNNYSSGSTTDIAFNSSFTTQMSIQDSSGIRLMSTSEYPVAIIFSTGSDGAANGENATLEAVAPIYESNIPTPVFDDQMIWITRPVLFYRMVQAGRLP